MVRLDINPDGLPIVIQQDLSPSVYLDHWAWRKFSQDSGLSKRFTRALEKRAGTLALSWLNLAEFSRVTDHSQGRMAEEFLVGNLPRIFFLDPDPFSVIRREDELLSGRATVPFAPHADIAFLSTFVRSLPDSPTQFTVRELFRSVQDEQLQPGLESLADKVAEGIQRLRRAHEEKRELQIAATKLPSGPDIQRGTRYVIRELVSSFLLNRGLKVSRNHAIDFMHTVVPVSYCEFVLLDKHWEDQVERVRTRLSKSPLNAPLARVYSEKSDGIERFFGDFDC